MPDIYLIVEPESSQASIVAYSLSAGAYVIGRAGDKVDILLEDKSVSRVHCTLFVEEGGRVLIQDENSSGGLYIDEKRVSPEFSIHVTPQSNILVGAFLLYIADSLGAGAKATPLKPRIHSGLSTTEMEAIRKPFPSTMSSVSKTFGAADFRTALKSAVASDAPPAPASPMDIKATFSTGDGGGEHSTGLFATFAHSGGEAGIEPDEEKRYTFPKMPMVSPAQQNDVDRFIYRRIKPLFEKLVQERSGGGAVKSDETREMALDILRPLIEQQAANLPADLGKDDMVTLCLAAFMDYGPLQTLLGDEEVTEIMVNSHTEIFVEKKGRITRSRLRFFNELELRRVIEKMVAITNRHIDEQQPYQDTRLEDGSRVNIIIRPLALRGDSITIRKFPNKRLFIEDLIRFGAMSEAMAEFLRLIVMYRANTVVSGGTGSGKTTLLNVLSGFIPEHERLVSIEDAAELRLVQPNRVCLETKPKSAEGGRAITIRDLVINALRMRPDRIVVGECRGGETMDMLQAMNTGHEGSLTTLHANTPRDALNRIETMCLMSGMELPARAIRNQVVSAVNFIVQQSRMADGSRKITSIQEIVGMEGEQVVMQEVFKFQRTGMDDSGKIIGRYEATGVVPFFVQKLREDRIDFPLDLFS